MMICELSWEMGGLAQSRREVGNDSGRRWEVGSQNCWRWEVDPQYRRDMIG